MKSYRALLAFTAISLLGATALAPASELVYRPINPSFGGDPLNGNWLLSQATAQTKGGGSPGFTIDFPDFGGIPQEPGDGTGLPPVTPGNNGTP
ncbi:curli assembly protein CsgF [Pseudaminobacter soli (ex Li et al. 2025)]|uniref:Curli production assembly/transport component CsgF n=1 Tax=Pseudaminobacter soli (ex Li et al. 2025) TaxID=1295366 RepID=A0A2P7SEB0_9HYPH|nr:curli assembly protein CsgF [Mesorhizobium soli]PSJ60810.1 curli assembly protein CsgF [Mesorhizobium soli]